MFKKYKNNGQKKWVINKMTHLQLFWEEKALLRRLKFRR
jgi:hypothetical protein